jgi:uncharacterized damage-inducible protein DinB
MDLFEPDNVGDELTLLTQFLDHHRSVMVRKAEGLSQAQMAQRLAPSTLTIGGLVKHLALVEDSWFQERLRGEEPREPWASVDWRADPDWELRTAADDDPAELLAMYQAACQRSRATVAQVGDLDAMTVRPNRHGELFSLRWLLLHMIEETARHNGHADLLRESIDGATGD